MTCTDCTERRNQIIEDVLKFRLLSAAGHVIVGAAEMAGVKDKPSERKAKKMELVRLDQSKALVGRIEAREPVEATPKKTTNRRDAK